MSVSINFTLFKTQIYIFDTHTYVCVQINNFSYFLLIFTQRKYYYKNAYFLYTVYNLKVLLCKINCNI